MGKCLKLIKVAFATKEATKHACKNWHYAHKPPSGALFSIGVWDDDHFLGVVIFSHGANNRIGAPYGLTQYQCVELTRVALRNHKGVFVSEIMAKAIKYLKEHNPNLILIVSYSDPSQNHKGGIYQANNWIYVGRGVKGKTYVLNGKTYHSKNISDFCRTRKSVWKSFKGTKLEFLQKYWDENMKVIDTPGKHKYLFPLNKKAKRKLMKIALPYPKSFDDGQKMKNIKLDLSDCVSK